MREVLKQKLNKKGFTLAELLIVVAIIAILAAIAFPIFSAQLSRAQASADLANLRNAISVAGAELTINQETTGPQCVTAFETSVGGTLPTPQFGSTTPPVLVISVTEVTNGPNVLNPELCEFGGNTLQELLTAAS